MLTQRHVSAGGNAEGIMNSKGYMTEYMRKYRVEHREKIRRYNRRWMREYRARKKDENGQQQTND
jgi:hypothetical protein